MACRIQPCRIGECSSFSIQSSGIEFLGVVLLESLVLLHECQYRILCFGKPSLFFLLEDLTITVEDMLSLWLPGTRSRQM